MSNHNPLPGHTPGGKIVRCLQKIEASGQRSHDIFEDWLLLTEATLLAIPEHTRSAIEGNKPLEDTPETQALWERTRKRYGHSGRAEYYFDLFSQAFSILLAETISMPLQAFAVGEGGETLMGPDILGAIYMAYAYPNPGAGQFFTPWAVSSMMGAMMGGGINEVHQRLKAALTHPDNIWGQSVILAGLMIRTPEEADQYFFSHVLPAAMPYYEPITVCDPAVGSGIMLLAMASQFPAWANSLGLVQYYCMDIDQTCVRMCRINCILYGLTPLFLKCALEMSQAELARLVPEPHATAYLEAQEAHQNGNNGRVKEIIQELREGAYQQASMFERA